MERGFALPGHTTEPFGSAPYPRLCPKTLTGLKSSSYFHSTGIVHAAGSWGSTWEEEPALLAHPSQQGCEPPGTAALRASPWLMGLRLKLSLPSKALAGQKSAVILSSAGWQAEGCSRELITGG